MRILKDFSKIDPKTIVYGEYAEPGAKGDAGAVRIYTYDGMRLRFYRTSLYSMPEIENAKNYEIGRDLLNSSFESGGLEKADGGFGNVVFKNKDIALKRKITSIEKYLQYGDDPIFITEIDGHTFELEASCLGVYIAALEVFIPSPVKREEVVEFLKSDDNFLTFNEFFFLEVIVNEYLSSRSKSINCSSKDWSQAIRYIRFFNRELFNFAEWEKWDCEYSLWKYRLRYILQKVGFNNFDNFIDTYLTKDKIRQSCGNGRLLELASELLDENSKVGQLFTIKKINQHEPTDDMNYEKLVEFSAGMFAFPELVWFTDEDDEKIQKQLLKYDGEELAIRARWISFYFANYLEFYSVKPYEKLLPVAWHIVENLAIPEEEDEDIVDLFWWASELINEYWKLLPKDEDKQFEFEKRIYAAYWGRIDGIWPIKNVGNFKFDSLTRQKIFDESLGWILCLDNINNINKEIGDYFEKLAQNTDIEKIRDHKVGFIWKKILETKLKVVSTKKKLELIESVFGKDYDVLREGLLIYPKTEREVKMTFDWLLGKTEGDRERCALTGYCRFGIMEGVMITGNWDGVGVAAINYIIEHFGILLDIFGNCEEGDLDDYCEDDEPAERRMVDLFTAICTGASEKSEIEPIKKLEERIKEMKLVEEDSAMLRLVDRAIREAEENIDAVAFQRKKMKISKNVLK